MSGVSKLEYLQKYLDDRDPNKTKTITKKKKKTKKYNKGNFKIIDNDISLSKIKQVDCEEEEFELEEEKPLIFAEDGSLLQDEAIQQEEIKKQKWKSMNDNKVYPTKSVRSNKQPKIRHDSSSEDDASPPRNKSKRVRHDSSDSDLSPVRRNNTKDHDSDISPPRRRKRDNNSDSDISPPRRRRQSDSDYSPVRKRKQDSDSDVSPPRKSKDFKSKRREELPEVIKISGLRTGSELHDENLRKKMKDKELFENMDKSISGKDAETIHRDRKTGKKVDLKFEELKKRKKEEERLEELEQFRKWGKGVAQEKSHQEKINDDLKEMQKPLARYKDDADLDSMLRAKVYEDDPMLAYIKKKKNPSNKPSKPRYNGPTPPPNRFNIWPGYRYDGVDRSNGFEKKRYLAISKMRSLKNEAYKWSTEDM